MPCGTPALPSATGPPRPARPRHARPTQQPSVSPANEGAPTPNSPGVEGGKVPSRGRVARSPGGGGHKKWKSKYNTATDGVRTYSPTVQLYSLGLPGVFYDGKSKTVLAV